MLTDVARLDVRNRRRGLLAYTIGMAAYAGVIVTIYPTFKNDSSLDALASGNSTMAALFGLSGSLTSPAGWMNANIYANFLPLIVLLMTIGYGASSIAGQDEDGLLGLVATLPLGRVPMAAQKAMALVVIALPVPVMTMLATLAGRHFQVALPTGPLLQATLAVVALGTVFGLLALLVGALTGSRATALGVASALAALSYIVSSLAPAVSWVHTIRWTSPFYWAVGGGQLTSGVSAGAATALVASVILLAGAALWAVNRMDIH
jgi:ABC-2 type transport system permease protein